ANSFSGPSLVMCWDELTLPSGWLPLQNDLILVYLARTVLFRRPLAPWSRDAGKILLDLWAGVRFDGRYVAVRS
ncbi:MAG: hypothetical protein JSV16_13515, partial [Candidatus Hydrogenedentota bacterium]